MTPLKGMERARGAPPDTKIKVVISKAVFSGILKSSLRTLRVMDVRTKIVDV